jgi:ABC-type polysaccharide/polyol phosphate transport system ATPase subunit
MARPVIRMAGIGKTFRIPLDKPATLKHRILHPRSTARYRHFEALRDLSFEVAEGEFLGIIGHNGSGKSTLLKILSGIYVADSGQVEVNGRVSPFLELGVGFNPELTARENIYLSGAVLGLTRRQLADRVDDIVRFAEIEEFAETKLKNYSSGMQVRLAFSVAIQADAEILLMDEVLAVGDASFQERCLEIFAEHKRQGRTVVLVTHDLGAVQTYCDRCILLDHGRMIAEGPPSDVTALYRRRIGGETDSTAEAAAIAETAARYGTRELSLTSVRLIDGRGQPHTTFACGAPMTVEVRYEVHGSDVGAFVCWLGIERSDGLPVAIPGTEPDGIAIEAPPRGGTGVIRYRVDRLPLLGAAYRLNVGLHDRHSGHAFDHVDGIASFRVVDERGHGGIVDLGGRWELESDRAVAEGALVAESWDG